MRVMFYHPLSPSLQSSKLLALQVGYIRFIEFVASKDSSQDVKREKVARLTIGTQPPTDRTDMMVSELVAYGRSLLSG